MFDTNEPRPARPAPSGPWPQAVEQLLSYTEEKECREAAEHLRSQDGCAGLRILPPSPAKPGWRVQAFFDVRPTRDTFSPPPQYAPYGPDWLPDGCRRVLLPPSILKECGIEVPEDSGAP